MFRMKCTCMALWFLGFKRLLYGFSTHRTLNGLFYYFNQLLDDSNLLAVLLLHFVVYVFLSVFTYLGWQASVKFKFKVLSVEWKYLRFDVAPAAKVKQLSNT